MRIDRRTVLKGMGAVALAPALPGCESPSSSSVTPALLRERIKTVVFVMMENRSFDHVFGSLSLDEGRDDVDGLRPGLSNPTSGGVDVAPLLTEEQCVANPGHSYDAAHAQWNDGKNDGFVTVHEQSYGTPLADGPMRYLNRAMQPVSYALADNYALCQRWFSSVMGPTWPNRYYSMLASSNGNTGNTLIDDDPYVSGELQSIFQRLDDGGVDWASYYGSLPFSALILGHSLEQPEYKKLDQFVDDAAAGKLPAFVHIDPTYGINDDHPPAHPLAGQILLSTIYTALARGPQWNNTLLVITYDEHGGFYDHVPPPTTTDERPAFRQLGFRVPSLVVGPYVKNTVANTTFEHTSMLASLLHQHELPAINDRASAANHLWDLLDEKALLEEKPAAPIDLPVVDVDEAELTADNCRDPEGIGLRTTGEVESGQPELEALFDARYPNGHPKDGRPGAKHRWLEMVARAEQLGLVRVRRG